MRWRKVTLAGVGLLGGSLGLNLRKQGLAGEIVGFVRREASIAECIQAGAVDRATLDLADAVRGADLVVLCTPIAQMTSLVARMLPDIKRGAIVTDVGSVKAPLVRDLTGLVAEAGAHYIGSHPMAGAEKTGVSSARVDLFQDAVCVITPAADSNRAAVRKVEALWKSAGGRVLRLDPGTHDELVCRASHLPHVLAAQLAAFTLDPARSAQQAMLCATGFRDSTRIASGSPEMWRDICLANSANLCATLEEFSRELKSLKSRIRRKDARGLLDFFQTAKERRDRWCAHGTARTQE